MKVYLAHGHRCRPAGRTLENFLMLWGHQVYNPFDGDQRATDLTQAWFKAAETGDRRKLLKLCAPIYEKDVAAIQAADIVVAYYPDESTGTAMEIPLSKHVHGKPVVVLTDIIHPFIQSNADYVFPCNDAGLKQLRKLLGK
jgi:nucleoside 2-deoxyribosyltransferase